MPKKAISAKKSGTKKQGKKPIAKAKALTALQRSKTIFYTKTTLNKSPSSPKKASPTKTTKTKDWEPGYKKEIQMFKTQPDYFQLNVPYQHLGVGTKLVHVANEPGQEMRGVSAVLDFSSTFAQPAPGEPVVFDYARCGNPTRLMLERQLASMECAKFAFATASGMNAHVTMMNLCQQGDQILCVDDVYGGTQRYLRKILGPNTGIQVDFSDFSDITKFKKMLTKQTKIVWLESPTNPTLKVFDIAKIAKAIKDSDSSAILVVDNTFASPILCNPILHGADVTINSVTKYIGGHSDILGGCICLSDRDLYDRIYFVLKSMGTGMCAFDSWLTLRSAKTLELRVHAAQKNAMAVAKMLDSHPKVVKCVYPGLKSHPQYALAQRQMRGPGAMISFYIKGGVQNASKFLSSLKIFALAESLGGVESLAENPALMTHGSVPAEVRKELGIEDNFIRLSVGIETEKDLIDDLKQALAKS